MSRATRWLEDMSPEHKWLKKKSRVFRCACDRLILPKGLKCIFVFFGPLSDSAGLAIAEAKIVVPWKETTVFFSLSVLGCQETRETIDSLTQTKR